MKRLLVLPVFLATLAALGQTPAAPMPSAPAPAGSVPKAEVGPAKVAVVSFQTAVSQTNEFQRAFVDLEKKWDPKRQQLKAQSDEIDRLTKELQTQGEKLSPDERTTRARSLDEKKKQFQRQSDDAQNDFGQAMQELFSNTASKVYDVLSSYAETNGFTVVLDDSNQTTPVLYWHTATDITKPVIDAYNTKSGVPPLPPGAGNPSGAPATSAPRTPGIPKPAAPKPTAPKTPPSQ